MTATRRPAARRLADAVRAADPGLARAVVALRAMLAAALGAGATYGCLLLADQPTGPAALAAAVGLFSVITLPEGPPRVWGPAVAAAAAACGVAAALLGSGPAGLAAVVLVTVLAAWLARWGPTGSSAGFVGFLVVVLTLRIGLGPATALGLVVAAVAGVLAVLVVTQLLVRDRPAPRGRRLARALLARLSLFVDAAERLAASGPGRRRQRRARLRLVAVQETALQLDQTLDELAGPAPEQDGGRALPDPDGSPTSSASAREAVVRLRGALLDVEALADHLLWSVLTIPQDAPDGERERAAATLRRERVEPPDDHGDAAPLVPRLSGHDEQLDQVVPRLALAVRRVRTEGARLRDGNRAGRPAVDAPRTDRRLVVQTGLACGLSLLLGLLVDPAEWHWAVIGAFIVVTTTSSRGAGLRKAADRVVGTAVGVVAGLWLADQLAERGTLLLVLLLATVAAMVWFLRVQYAVFMVALTVAVALLYEVTGMLTTELLALRLAETALGAAIAAGVVAFVLPVPTGRTVDDAVDDLLAALADALADLADDGRLTGEHVRAVDRAVSAVREVTAPVASGLPLVADGQVRSSRLLATALRVRVAALATAAAAAPPDDDDERALALLRERVVALRRHLDGGALPDDDETEPVPAASDVGEVLRALDDRLVGYGTARGISLRGDPGALAGGTGRPND